MTLATIGNAWIHAAVFERNRLCALKAPTTQDGVSPQIRALACEDCERNIALYEHRACITLQAALRVEAEGYQFTSVGAA